MRPTKLFVFTRQSGQGDIRLIDPERKTGSAAGTLYKKVPADFSVGGYEIVEDPADADFVLIPHTIKQPEKVTEYLDSAALCAKKYGKKALVFFGGDPADGRHIDRPEFLVWKAAGFKSDRHENELIYAPFAEDLGETNPFTIRKKSAKPIVSFCGNTGFGSKKSAFKYYARNFVLDLVSLISPRAVARKRGIYFRRRALSLLSADARIDAKFIIRDQFGGNAKNVADPAKNRREYVENLRDTDLVLCPKGDGNYSSRFYETLSLGRIPLLIDTDMCLPLEHSLEYDAFTLRVKMEDLDRIGDIVVAWYGGLTEEAFATMQKAARRAYEERLRFDAFFRYALPRLAEEGKSAVL